MTQEELLNVALLQAKEESSSSGFPNNSKKEFIEAMLTWFRSPKVGNDEELDRKFLASAYDNITHTHWISVEDELPPCNVFVLTCDEQGNENLLMLGGNGRWYDKAVGLHRNITHWMPMPEAPSSSEFPNNCKKGGEK